jgi:hypothetical protein
VAHVVAADLVGAVGEALGILARGRQQQQPRRFERVAGDAHDARLLALLLAVLVEIDDAGHLASGVVLDARDVALGAHLEPARGLAGRDLGVEGRPLGAGLAALEAEPELLAGAAAVARLRVDRHAPGVDLLVAELLGAGLEHLVVGVAG